MSQIFKYIQMAMETKRLREEGIEDIPVLPEKEKPQKMGEFEVGCEVDVFGISQNRGKIAEFFVPKGVSDNKKEYPAWKLMVWALVVFADESNMVFPLEWVRKVPC